MTDPMEARRAAIYADFATQIDDGLAKLAINPNLHDGLRFYALDGRPVGSFLTACIDNDLREAVSRGDDASLASIKGIVQFFYNFTPGRCHGSREKRERWQATGGIRGNGGMIMVTNIEYPCRGDDFCRCPTCKPPFPPTSGIDDLTLDGDPIKGIILAVFASIVIYGIVVGIIWAISAI